MHIKSLKGFHLDCFDSRFSNLSINKNKILIGSSEICDLIIKDDSISYLHAMILVKEEGLHLVDLESKNGTKVNGESIDKSYLNDGDVVSFSRVQFRVNESVIKEMLDLDKNVRRIKEEEIILAQPEKTGLVLIDDEYCDIVFENEEVFYVDTIQHIDIGRKNYVDPYEYQKEDAKSITVGNSKLSLEVSIFSAGNLIDCEVLEIKSARYLNKEINRIFSYLGEDVQLRNQAGKISIESGHSISKRKVENNENLTGNQCVLDKNIAVAFNKGVNEIVLNLVEVDEKVTSANFFMKDPVLFKESVKVVGTVLGIAFLLLFVDTTLPKPVKKKEFVIYKKAIPKKVVQEKSSESVANKNVDHGTQMDKSDKVIQKAVAKNDPKPVKKKAIKPKKKSAPKKIAKTKPKVKPVKKALKKVVKVKPKFKLKLRKSLKGVIAQTKVTNVKSRSVASLNNSSSVVGSGQLSESSGLRTLSNLGEGNSLSGNYAKSKGIRGSSTKRGIDMANTSRKTVVLGSMDPELLRKILREYLPQFRHCYQAELDGNDKSQGTVDLNFRISGTGKVSAVKIKGKKFTKGTVNCLSSVLKLIQFPRQKGGGVVDVRQPLNFSSSKNRI